MVNLKKSQQKRRFALIGCAVFSIALTGISCDRGGPETTTNLTGGTDAKIAADRLTEAEALWEGREDLAKVRVAVAALRQARTADYSNYEAAWKLARASFYVGDHTENDDERDNMFRGGTEAGKSAVKLQPDKPEGHFWLGANYGGAASHSTIANLSSFNDIKTEMEAVLRIDETYQGYSAYLGLGRLYLQAPRMFGGDTSKAIEYLEKGVKLNPNHSLMRYHLAQAYESDNRDGEAKKQLETVMGTTPDPKYMAEHKDAVEKSKKLLEQIEANRR
ncbi:MAG TPA: TRAP transporter TatT component family protein [Pyrinomonadaceae bacterium]|nr:TRAP transporter TatT component family protein [Pyrinomonadaceae bacterium]